ncbi:rifin [Plasmodium sp. gorilla clade G1]|nr:rifin [Plasmodium sp. gorilla clade G1]
MKVHYINILLFALPLNILKHNQRNHIYTTYHTSNTKPTKTHRTLCECELYAPSNYDNHPEMKEVMENFNRQTSERFHEYDERMQVKRQKYKEQYDKDIQTIILKQKIQKELTETLSALETNIDMNDIPTCVCENCMAHKTENFCLNSGRNLGVALPGLGILGAYGTHSMVQAAIASGIDFATKEGIKAGTQAGIQAAIKGVTNKFLLETLGGKTLQTVITSKTYNKPMFFVQKIMEEYYTMCETTYAHQNTLLCTYPSLSKSGNPTMLITTNARAIATEASKAATKMTTETTKAITAEKTAEATSASAIFSNPIVISFIVVIIILIIFSIIYLILCYLRKKKVKKKLQYIKLLK